MLIKKCNMYDNNDNSIVLVIYLLVGKIFFGKYFCHSLVYLLLPFHTSVHSIMWSKLEPLSEQKSYLHTCSEYYQFIPLADLGRKYTMSLFNQIQRYSRQIPLIGKNPHVVSCARRIAQDDTQSWPGTRGKTSWDWFAIMPISFCCFSHGLKTPTHSPMYTYSDYEVWRCKRCSGVDGPIVETDVCYKVWMVKLAPKQH